MSDTLPAPETTEAGELVEAVIISGPRRGQIISLDANGREVLREEAALIATQAVDTQNTTRDIREDLRRIQDTLLDRLHGLEREVVALKAVQQAARELTSEMIRA
jgi:hypothetical protein